MEVKDLLENVRGKRVPNLSVNARWADLSLQELAIVEDLGDCCSLEDVERVLDKCLAYIALSKNLVIRLV